MITLYDPYQSPNTVIDDVELVSALQVSIHFVLFACFSVQKFLINWQGIQRCITRILQEGLTDKNNVVTSMTVNYTYMTTPLLGQQFHDPDDLENCDINNCGLFVTLFAMLYTNSPGFKHTLANALSSSELVPRNTGALALRQLFYGLLLRELERSKMCFIMIIMLFGSHFKTWKVSVRKESNLISYFDLKLSGENGN